MPEAELSLPADAEDLPLLREAAREAGRIAMGFFRRNPESWFKEGQSPVSAADIAADRFLHETLRSARPAYGWLSEETVDGPDRLRTDRVFVVDPIDGTRAFLGGLPTWCVSVAVVEKGRPVAGVLECPAKGEIFEALPGRGAFLNGRPIRVRPPSAEPEVAGPKAFIDALPRRWREGVKRIPHVPSLAYRLAMIAKGELDATFVKPNAHDWDLAAADLILSEAGGRVLAEDREPPRYGLAAVPRHGALVAGSGPFLDAAARAITAFPRLT